MPIFERSETSWTKKIPRIFYALAGSVFFRFPLVSFQVAVASLQKKQIWSEHFLIPCISDCRVYGELADGIDATGSFRWTYFPIWPKLVHLFSFLLPSRMNGYDAAVILSWALSIACGVLLLEFFDRFWTEDERTFGYSDRAWLLLLLLSIYPHGHFWLQGYSEPLFCIVLLGALLMIWREQIILAGVAIGLASAIRPQGFWLPPIWGLLLVMQSYRGRIQWKVTVPSVGFSGVGCLGLLAWYWIQVGDPFYYYKIQAVGGYGRSFNLLGGIFNHLPRWDSAVLYLYLALVGSIQLIRNTRFSHKALGWFGLALTEVPLFFGGFYSYVRFLSLDLPLFILLTEYTRKSRWRETVLVIFFLTRLAIQVYKSGFHEWVG